MTAKFNKAATLIELSQFYVKNFNYYKISACILNQALKFNWITSKCCHNGCLIINLLVHLEVLGKICKASSRIVLKGAIQMRSPFSPLFPSHQSLVALDLLVKIVPRSQMSSLKWWSWHAEWVLLRLVECIQLTSLLSEQLPSASINSTRACSVELENNKFSNCRLQSWRLLL